MVNNFSIVVASTNGSGSQTANLVLLRALFSMGIPVSSKNIFPSNIQGSPTWYHIRLSSRGFEAFRNQAEVLVAFNQKTYKSDISTLLPGSVCLHPDDSSDRYERSDVTHYSVPVKVFLRDAGVRGRNRDYLSNMVYVGALAQLLGIDLSKLEEALGHHFKDRSSLLEMNLTMVRKVFDWTAQNIQKEDPFSAEEMDTDHDRILITGNEAAALGSIFGGVSLVSWYPITPATTLVDALSGLLPQLRTDPETGKATYAVIQAEDELSAIGMVIGAGWAGARAMTATSGPGISLMTEFAGLGYFAEVPAVIWDVQRIGPSTGMPTRTAQGDVMSTYFLGHGDTANILLFPATVSECFEFGYKAFDLAEQLQTPVFVMSDLDLGMNTWASDPFEYPKQPMKRGKVLSEKDVGESGFARFLDIDGDGITYRTFPGNEHPLAAYLSRGTGHNREGFYSEGSDDWEDNMERLSRKFETARKMVPEPMVEEVEEAEIGFIAFGSTLPAVEEVRAKLSDQSITSSFMRIRSLPFSENVRDFIQRYQRLYVIELNRDGQMHKLLSMEYPELAEKTYSLSRSDGLPLTASWILDNLPVDVTES
jgi:2-oxoglutarate ferredoxin oxidoreductase subunit alpha